MTNKMNINWFPGHMKKTLDNLKKSIRQVDLVLELVDARIPMASRNPILDDIISDKARIILLNKSDLGDERENQRWKSYLEDDKTGVILINALSGQGLKKLRPLAENLLVDKFSKQEELSMVDRTIRMMIVGIPNVGKSSLINTLSQRKGTKVGNKPGITRQNQWINTGNDMDLLDTPGVLWPKFEEEEGLKLAFTGAIKDEILDRQNLAYKLIEKLVSIDPSIIEDRYGIKIEDEGNILDIMDAIGRKRGCLLKGAEIDYEKVGQIIISEFRSGKLGRISLETVNEY